MVSEKNHEIMSRIKFEMQHYLMREVTFNEVLDSVLIKSGNK